MSTLSREQAESIIEAGILAPSADNHHLVRFQIGGDEIRITESEDIQVAPFHRQVLWRISLGAVVENMTLRAARLGLKADVVWRADANQLPPIATLRFSPCAPRECSLEQAIPSRHTNRRLFFRGPPLTAAQKKLVQEDVDAFDDIRLVWLDAPDLRGRALRLIRIAETERFREQALHRELFDAIRFDVGWKATAQEGIPPGALEVEPFMRPVFQALRSWPLQRALNLVAAHKQIGLRAGYLPCRFSPHICVLSTSNADPIVGAFRVGAAFERIWLRATGLGYALQPLVASAIYALDRCDWVSTPVRVDLATGWKSLCPEALPLVVFRVGRAMPASVRSERPVFAAYLDSRGLSGS